MNSRAFLWVEKYRPQKLSDCVLPDSQRSRFQNMIDKNEIQNMAFVGPAGTGKTTMARVLCNELGLDYIFVNGSKDGNIDTLRNRIQSFASTVSLEGIGKPKVVILDEADYLNAQSTQPALRAFIEEFSDNCRFVFTANYKNKLLAPLLSRAQVIDFSVSKNDLPQLAAGFYKRALFILKNEGIEFDKSVVPHIVAAHMPDWRKVVQQLQFHSNGGKLTAQALDQVNNQDSVRALIPLLKNKDFKMVKQWVADNNTIETAAIFRALFDLSSECVEAQSVPELVVLLADYQYKAAFSIDQEIVVLAALTEIMSEIKFR